MGEPFLFLADEFYIKAGIPFPSLDAYGDLPQLENGVGMIPLFRVEAAKVLRKARRLAFPRAVVVTGVSAFPEITAFLKKLSRKTGVEFRPVAVENRLFGPSVTVTGLVNDIVVGTVNTQQATVTVNGVAAQVANRSFSVSSIPLVVGANAIHATAVDAATGTVDGTIPLGGKPEFSVEDDTGIVYVNIEDKSELVAINAGSMKITTRWSLSPCEEPSGLAIDQRGDGAGQDSRGIGEHAAPVAGMVRAVAQIHIEVNP